MPTATTSSNVLQCAHDVSLTFVTCVHLMVLPACNTCARTFRAFYPPLSAMPPSTAAWASLSLASSRSVLRKRQVPAQRNRSTGALASNQGTSSSRLTQFTPCHALSRCAAHQGQHVCRHRLFFLRLFLDGLVPVGIPELHLHRRQAPVRPGDDWQDPLVWPVVSAVGAPRQRNPCDTTPLTVTPR